jgi:glycine cleavage system protein P-like pyridoxal-binding family
MHFMSHKLFMHDINTDMKTFTALIKARVNGTERSIPTQVRAINANDARWLLHAIYGFHAVLSAPSEVAEELLIDETASKTPEQLRLDSLKAAKDRANAALKAERERIAKQKAVKTLAQINRSN